MKKKLMLVAGNLTIQTVNTTKLNGIIDIEKNIFKRLGGLGIRSNQQIKIVIIGLGIVGSSAARLVKAGATNLF